MKNVTTVANNGLTIVENYNKLFEQIRQAKTSDDIRILIERIKDFTSVYKKADNAMVNKIYEQFQTQLKSLIEENSFVYERMLSKVNEARGCAYDFAGEADDSQAVQNRTWQLMAQLPKIRTTANANAITAIISHTVNSGVIGSKAVLELLKLPAFADMVSEKYRQKAFEGSKTPAQLSFERLKKDSLKEAEHALSSVYTQGFHLRNMEKQVNAFMQPSNWGVADNSK